VQTVSTIPSLHFTIIFHDVSMTYVIFPGVENGPTEFCDRWTPCRSDQAFHRSTDAQPTNKATSAILCTATLYLWTAVDECKSTQMCTYQALVGQQLFRHRFFSTFAGHTSIWLVLVATRTGISTHRLRT